MRWAALWLLIRRARAGRSAVVLPVIAFAVMIAAVLGTTVLARLLWQAADEIVAYKLLAAALVTVVVVPLSTLGASAARLSARRRDDRLATLRLLGATSRWVRLVAVVEATSVAVAGVVVGILVHFVSTPSLTLIRVRGRTPDIDQVWLPWWVVALAALAVTAVAVISAVTGLRRVVLSPLGVRTRVDAPRLGWARVVIGGGVIGGAVALMQMLSADWGVIGATAAVALAVIATMAVLGVIGPFIIGRIAARSARRATTSAELIAARGILESPQAAWRQVSGLALISFLVIPVGSFLGYVDLIGRSSTDLPAEIAQIFTDARTVLLAAVAVTFVLVACSIGVSQAASVIEPRTLHVSLDRLGMPVAEMHRARHLAVLWSLRIAVLGSVVAAGLVGFSFVLTMIVMAPLFMAGTLGVLIGGCATVLGAVAATRPILRETVAQPERAL